MMGILDNYAVLIAGGLTLGIPALGLIVGYWIDRDHRANLDYRRREVGHVLVTNLRSYPGLRAGSAVMFIAEPVVIANNAFATAIGRLKLIFGGEVRSFHGVVTRTRQEAVLRVMERAAEAGYNAIGNVRLEAIDLSGQTVARGNRKNKAQLNSSMIAYGTAYHREEGFFPPPAPPTLLDYLQ